MTVKLYLFENKEFMRDIGILKRFVMYFRFLGLGKEFFCFKCFKTLWTFLSIEIGRHFKGV
jgi:hypothetical protein